MPHGSTRKQIHIIYRSKSDRDGTMKRVFALLACACVVAGGAYFAASKWAIRHETLNLFDVARQRPVAARRVPRNRQPQTALALATSVQN